MSQSTFIVDREKLEVRVERAFAATPERLFEAYTDPAQIPQWWGPSNLKTVVDKLDFKVGGAWRFVHIEADGTQYGFSGIYKEIEAPNKIVYTFEYEPIPGHVLEETVTFEAQPDGTTKLAASARYANLEDLDGMVNAGMESGAVESQDRLAKLVEKTI